jgi:hypothetical protein
MTMRMLCAAALATAAAAVAAGAAHAVTPTNGGDAGGTATTVNNGAGDQTEPHIGGNLAVYTDRVGLFTPGTIRYYDFSMGSDSAVPGGAPGDSDVLSDVDGGRIAFSRTRAADGLTAVLLFDVASGIVTELNPQGSGMMRFGAVVGGDTVAYTEFASGGGDIFVYDLAAGAATNLAQSLELDMNPGVAPGGDVVVWEHCIGSNCNILQSVRSGGAWGAPTVVAATSSNESNPDSDGTTVVYDSERPSATSQDVYLRPVSGGSEIALELPGPQRNPAISAGVVSFESKTAPETPADLFVYVIATNTVYRVTNTPTVDETLNDVTVLPSGQVRLVWAADDDAEPGLHNVYARTFTVPLTTDTAPPTIACGSAGGVWHAANVSIACTAADGGSGLANPADASFTLSTSVPAGAEDGDASTGTRQVCDAAGNCATAGPIGGNKVDRNAPTLSLPVALTVNATSPAGATVSYAATATDGADPSPAVSCTPVSGSIFAIGTTTVACTATDHVGNSSADPFTVTVRGAEDQLARLIQDVMSASTVPAPIKARLLARLQSLLATFDPNDPKQRRAVCAALNAFATAVQLLSGHAIPPAQAGRWIADANRIRAVLGC